ncbi:amino acid permease/ SLC12A domain-containing protein [Zopfochytrium polystomum]|nr:amino acid permease/ SLC12A domain-containing protein [Zopfochytrium polystomum]
MMSIGGTIGTGLFVASGLTIATAGPVGALLAYAVVGTMVFFVIASLGEMSALIPVSGSFHEFAGRFVDPALAWCLGWQYWLQWAISLPSELAAAGIITSFWLPTVPPMLTSLLLLVALLAVNTRDVRQFGETEFWIALVKVLAVVLFILAGAAIDLVGFPGEQPLLFKNWSVPGAPFKNGLLDGFVPVFAIAFFGFGGTEMVGVSAGEVSDPRTNVPKAINQTFWRILVFYFGSIGVIGLLIPNDDPNLALAAETNDVTIAPFTLILLRAGLGPATHLMNLVILSAVVSAANSALYAASRTLVALADRGHAHRVFAANVDAAGVPWAALAATTAVACLAFLGIAWGEGVVFSWLLTLMGTSGLLTWMSISITHLRFRRAYLAQGRRLEDLPYLAPFYPFGDYLALAIGVLIIAGQTAMAVSADPFVFRNLLSVLLGLPLFASLYLGYKFRNQTKIVPLEKCDFSI